MKVEQTRVLHICGAFVKQNIYKQLFNHLSEQGLEQGVYSAVRSLKEVEVNLQGYCQEKIFVSHILNKWDRIFFRNKIKKICMDLKSKIDVKSYGLIHSHFLYSDGGVALQIKKTYGIPYIVAVRNTDLNTFMKYRPDLNGKRDEILENASKVIIISPTYEDKLLKNLNRKLAKKIEKKLEVIPNGAAPEWFSSIISRSSRAEELRLLYVGDFSRNKNIEGILDAVSILMERQVRLKLTIVGGGGKGERQVLDRINSADQSFIDYKGRINESKKLKKIYEESDIFVMPSFQETFGVVYIEALSQGLPIIHSKEQGVDGYFTESPVAESVNPTDAKDIANKILLLRDRLPEVSEQCVEEAKRFQWNNIASQYIELYKGVGYKPISA